MQSKQRGILAGLGSGLFWGLDGILIIFAVQVAANADFGLGLGIIGIAGILACLKESVMLIFISIFQFATGDWQKMMKNFAPKENRRAFIFMALAAICAGPIGMTAYALAANYAGSALAAVISAIYPVLAAVGSHFILRNKLGVKGWLGVIIVTLSIVFIVSLGGGELTSTHLLLGLACAFIAAIGWGSESVLLEYGLRNSSWTSSQSVFIRQLVSFIVYFVVVIPFFTNNEGWQFIAQSFNNPQLLLFIGFLAINMLTSYLLYYYAIDVLGAVSATSLNVTYVLFASLWTMIFLQQSLSLLFWALALCTIFGIILVIRNVNVK